MMKEDMLKVRDVVIQCLREDERCRNDDKWLTIQALRKMGVNIYIDYKDLKHMPSFESIRRSRAQLQSEGLYPATTNTRQMRNKNQKEMQNINKWI